MEWVTNKTTEYKAQRKECWHRWFAWHPVCVRVYPDGARKRVWLQYVKRKGTFLWGFGDCYWEYEYKKMQED